TATTQMNCADSMELPATGIFRRPFAGAVTTVALVGEATGIGPTTWASFRGTPAIANNGKIGFSAGLAGTPAGGLFFCDPAVWPAAGPVGGAQPGELGGSGTAFRYSGGPAVSDAGDLAFNTRVSGGPDGVTSGTYVWRSASDTFDVIARRIDPVPGITGAY